MLLGFFFIYDDRCRETERKSFPLLLFVRDLSRLFDVIDGKKDCDAPVFLPPEDSYIN